MRESIDECLREQVLKRDGYRCRYCGSTESPFHLDHVYPVSKGGETTIDNLVTACVKCNLSKHNKIGIWPVPLENYNKDEILKSVYLFLIGLFLITTPYSSKVLFSISSSASIFEFTLAGFIFIGFGIRNLYKYI